MKLRLNKGLTNRIKRGIMKVEGTFTFGRVFAKAKTVLKRCAGFKPKLVKPRSDKTEHHAHWARRYTMKKFMTRALGALAITATLALVACGGGGGGGSTVTPPPVVNTCSNGASDYPTCTPAPTITGIATTPATGATDVALGSNVQVTFTTNGTLKSGTASVDASCAGTAVSGNFSTSSAPWTFDPILGLPEGKTCTVMFNGVFTSAGGLPTNLSVTTVFTTHSTTPATYWSPKPTFAPMGTKVLGANQLPAGCTSWTQQCWKDSVANGAVKFVTSGGKDSTGRDIVFAYFRNTTSLFGVNGLWNYLPFYADTGAPASQDINGGTATAVDYIVGNSVGAVIQSSGQCFENYNAGSTWSNRSVTCP